MKNLKKVLALVLAATMSLTMMASAAFTDAKDINATEAVDTLAALGIIGGYTDGSYQPEKVVTRGEMAKMIFTLRNSGKSDASFYNTIATTFRDINGHWAAGYIKYAQSLGIIAGKSATSFAPDAPVTGLEAAKMLLVTMGYDANKAGLVGSSWAMKTVALASENGLFDDYAGDLAAGAPRQYAAQLIYNAIYAETVKLENGEYIKTETTVSGIEMRPTGQTQTIYTVAGVDYTDYAQALANTTGGNTASEIQSRRENVMAPVSVNYKVNETVGNKYMSLTTTTGVLTVAGYSSTGVTGSEKTIELASGSSFVKVEKDYSHLLGQEVKVLYKSYDKVYGVAPTSKNTVVESVVGKVDTFTATSVKVDGTKYDIDSATRVFVIDGTPSKGSIAANSFAGINESATVKFISNDNNKKFDIAVIYPITIAKVTYVNSEKILTTGGGDYKFDENVVYDGVKVNDFVSVKTSTFDDKNVVAKLEIITGKVDGIKNNNKEILVDGTWYKTGTGKTGDSYTNGDTFDLAVLGGYIYNAKKTSESAKITDILYVSAHTDVLTMAGIETKAYLADGTSKIIQVKKINEKDATASTTPGDKNVVIDKTMYTFKIKDGGYELTTVSAANKAGFSDYANAVGDFDKDKDSFANAKIADDAVIFVQSTNGTGSVKVLTGTQVKAWDANVTAASNVALTETVNGFKTVKVGALNTTAAIPGATGDSKYAFVTTSPYQVKIGDDTFDSYKIWNGTEELDVLDEDDDLDIKKGDFISYTKLADNKIKSSTVTGTAGAVTAFDGKNIQINDASGAVIGTLAEIDKDTNIIYVNTKDSKGVEAGEIALAIEQADGSRVLNVVATTRSSNKIDVIFVDVNNDLDKLANDGAGRAGAAVTAPAITPGDVNGIAIAAGASSVDKSFAIAGDVVTVTVVATGTATGNATITVIGTNTTSSTATKTFSTGNAGGTFTFEFTVSANATATSFTVAIA